MKQRHALKTGTFLAAAAALSLAALSGCGKSSEPAYLQKTFIMNVPAQVKVYGAGEAEGRQIAEAVFAEWKRVSGEFSYSDPYSLTSVVNKRAYGEWVRVDEEFLSLLELALGYARLTDGAFDITFAPLWPIWKEAASTKKLPAKADIQKALSNIGSSAVHIDKARRMVRFSRPVQINLGGILRGYCFVRAARMLREMAPPFRVELWLGSNMLAYGKGDWVYPVTDPFNADKVFGRFHFGEGVMLSSSGREHFVQIEGRLYSHILDLKTGYPLPDFSSLVVYFPRLEDENFMSSAMLAVMGREKAFEQIAKMKGTAAVWIDGSGRETVFTKEDSSARWAKEKKLF